MIEPNFIRELQKALGGLPPEQSEDILAEYRSHFFEGKERGKTEEEIARSLGDPRTVARAYLADYHFTAWRTPAPGQSVTKSVRHLLTAVLVTLSLLFFNFFFMLVPILVYASVLFTTWLMAFGIAVVSLIGLGAGIAGQTGPYEFAASGAQYPLILYCFGALSLMLALVIGLFYLTRFSIRALIKYIRLNIKLASEGGV